MAESAALRRVTDLFIEGTELVLDEYDPVLVWINKLNPFQQDEARRDGSAARTRLMLALADPRSEESQSFDVQTEKLDDDRIAQGMAQAKVNMFTLEVTDELAVDKDWKDKVEVLTRGAQDLADRAVDDPEVVALEQLGEEYLAELTARTDARRQGEYESLKSVPRDELRQLYRERWADDRGNEAYMQGYRITEFWYALRECAAPGRTEDGQWDHAKCDHRIKLLDGREQVTALPDGLIRAARDALVGLVVDDRTGKGSPASRGSSPPSPTPSAPAESVPSGPAKTSRAPARTSTRQ